MKASGPNLLHEAVIKGDLEAVKSHLTSNKSIVDQRDIDGYTPLLKLCSLSRKPSKYMDIARYLRSAGADIQTTVVIEGESWNAARFATEKEFDSELAEFLLMDVAPEGASEKEEEDALPQEVLAMLEEEGKCSSDSEEALKNQKAIEAIALEEASLDFFQKMLLDAINKGDLDEVVNLIHQGMAPGLPVLKEIFNNKNMSIPMLRCILVSFLAQGSDLVDAMDFLLSTSGNQLLHCINMQVPSSKEPVVNPVEDLLIDAVSKWSKKWLEDSSQAKEIDFCKPPQKQEVAVSVCFFSKKKEAKDTAIKLIKKGVNLSAQPVGHHFPILDYGFQDSYDQEIGDAIHQYLLGNKACLTQLLSIYKKNKSNVLSRVLRVGHNGLLKLFLQEGADRYRDKDSLVEMPLVVAIDKRNKEAFDMLLAEYDFSILKEEDHTALWSSVFIQGKEGFQYIQPLLKKGAYPSQSSKFPIALPFKKIEANARVLETYAEEYQGEHTGQKALASVFAKFKENSDSEQDAKEIEENIQTLMCDTQQDSEASLLVFCVQNGEPNIACTIAKNAPTIRYTEKNASGNTLLLDVIRVIDPADPNKFFPLCLEMLAAGSDPSAIGKEGVPAWLLAARKGLFPILRKAFWVSSINPVFFEQLLKESLGYTKETQVLIWVRLLREARLFQPEDMINRFNSFSVLPNMTTLLYQMLTNNLIGVLYSEISSQLTHLVRLVLNFFANKGSKPPQSVVDCALCIALYSDNIHLVRQVITLSPSPSFSENLYENLDPNSHVSHQVFSLFEEYTDRVTKEEPTCLSTAAAFSNPQKRKNSESKGGGVPVTAVKATTFSQKTTDSQPPAKKRDSSPENI